MKMLYIIPSFQHPTMRGSARHYYFIRELARRHRITLLVLSKTQVTPEAREEMNRYAERILTFGAPVAATSASRKGPPGRLKGRVQRALQARSAVKEMKRRFLQLVHQESFDVVLFHGKDAFPVIDGWNGLPIVVDFCDATSMRVRQSMRYAPLAELPWRLLRYLEVRRMDRRLLRKTPHLAFISGRDRDAMLGPGNRARVIPNGIDLGYWTRKTHDPNPNCIVYTGVMDYPPNADGAFYLLEKILPLVRRSLSSLEVFIVGRDPSPALIEAARQYPDVTVTGRVDDIRPYLERAAVFAAPLRYGSGMQNKVLEALAMQVPVITTPVVAAGLQVDGSQAPPVQAASNEQEFAQGLLHLLNDEPERGRLAVAGRRFVEDHFDWSRGARMLEEMCLEAIAHAQPNQRNAS